jgi:hypothetical protein
MSKRVSIDGSSSKSASSSKKASGGSSESGMDRKKLTLLGVTAFCLVAAGVLFALNSGLFGKKQTKQIPQPDPIESVPQEMRQQIQKELELQIKESKGRPTAGS